MIRTAIKPELGRDGSHGADTDGALLFCCAFSDKLVQRSSVLESLVQSNSQGRPARLPPGISQAEFLLWSSNDPQSRSADVLTIKDMAAIVMVRYIAFAEFLTECQTAKQPLDHHESRLASG